MKKVLVLVEGHTEEGVVRDALGPHMQSRGLCLVPVILKTRREKWGTTFKGGVTSFRQIERDLRALLGDSSAVAVTTLIDYYGLPDDFPGLASRPSGTASERVTHVEQAFADAIGNRRFLPHLTLHEIEAWVFVDPQRCRLVLSGDSVANTLSEMRDACGGAEEINENPASAPSKRILDLVSDYQKPFHGVLAITEIGMDAVRSACPHADSWLQKLEAVGL